MINLHVFDDESNLYLAGYYLPRAVVFRALPTHEKREQNGKDYSRVPDDVGVAAVLESLAQRIAAAHLFEQGREYADRVTLDTWILRPTPSKGGALRSWYAYEPIHTRYRVFIHQTPQRSQGCALPLLWDRAYEALEALPEFALKRRAPSADALREGAVVLGNALLAYRAGPERVREFMMRLGHPVAQLA